ncbi:SCP2 sterol-binding domain-containing protein [Gammaproteobacteria bacterium]|nr:SCP2 sterol-binding domain-containing protein [Gammaproteobacteria bacterium]
MNECIRTSALWPGERIINYVIQNDPHVEKKISPLVGKSIRVEVKSPELFFSVTINKDSINITSIDSEQKDLAPDLLVSGDLKDLTSMLLSTGSLIGGNISVKGDIQFAQDLNEALRSLNLNWSDILGPILGQAATSEIERFFNASRTWSLEFRDSLKRDIEGYLKEEKKVIPTHDDAQEFYDDVDQLKFKIDRIKARADLLSLTLEGLDN